MSEIRFIVQRDITLKIMVFLTGVTGSLVSALKKEVVSWCRLI